MDRPRIAIVIPALNEAETIDSVVKGALFYGLPIVVNDGSIDNTADIAKQAGAAVVTHKKNMGYDSALNSGFRLAADLGVEIIITVDADGQHNPSLINRFIDLIDADSDVVIGIRSRRQRIAEYLYAWYTNIRLELRTQCVE